jgi:hypothetical protein
MSTSLNGNFEGATLDATKNESDMPTKEDESSMPTKEDESSIPTKEDESSIPTKEDESSIPTKEDETNAMPGNRGYLADVSTRGFFVPSVSNVQMRGDLGSNKFFEVTQEYVEDFESLGELERIRSTSKPVRLQAPRADTESLDYLSDDDEVIPGRQINQRDGYTINKKAFREWQKQQTFEKPTEEEAYSGPALRPPVDDTSDHDDDFYSDDEVGTAHHGLKQQTCDLQVPDNLSRFYGLASTTWHDSDIKGDKNLQPTAPGPAWTGRSARTFREANKAFAEKYWKDGAKVNIEEEYTGPGLSPPIDDSPTPSKRNKIDSPSNSPSQVASVASPTSSATLTSQDGDQDQVASVASPTSSASLPAQDGDPEAAQDQDQVV